MREKKVNYLIVSDANKTDSLLYKHIFYIAGMSKLIHIKALNLSNRLKS